MIIKRASSEISQSSIKYNAIDQDDPEILQYFKKTASDLKTIAPRAKDFLYFTCIMMHAAEASALDENGNLKKTASGEDVQVGWDELPTGALVWKTNDPSIKPFKNNNSDIFPESQLKIAHKLWVGKPLCLDHQSQSVDMVRGIIVDTVYDEKHKRIIALCALDKVNYPDLARKVASGYATSVSMGTAVGKAICTEAGCHKVARIEPDFCEHMRSRTCYGEINIDLSPIELSIVVNPADPGAKIRRVIAQSNAIAEYVDSKVAKHEPINDSEANELQTKIAGLKSELEFLSSNSENSYDKNNKTNDLIGDNLSFNSKDDIKSSKVAQEISETISSLKDNLGNLDKIINKIAFQKEELNNLNKDNEMSDKRAYFQGGGGVNEPTPGKPRYEKEDADSIRNTKDKQMVGQMDTGPVDGMHPGYESFGESELDRKKRLQRAAAAAERKMRREAAVEAAKEALKNKSAYFNGGGGANEPTPGKPKYEKEDSDSIRLKDDKQMNGAAPFPGVGDVNGLYGDDEKKKELLSRASKLKARFVKASAADGSDDLGASRWDIYAQDSSGKTKLVLSATVSELAGNKVAALYPAIATQEYGSKMIKTIRTAGLKAAAGIYKGAQAVPQAEVAPAAEMPAQAMPMAPVADAVVEPVSDVGEDAGSTLDDVKKLVNELKNLESDLEKAVEALEEEKSSDVEELPVATASVSIHAMGKVLRASLIKGMKEATASLSEIQGELDLIKTICEQGLGKKDASAISAVFKETVKEASEAKANALTMMGSFVRYAQGMESLSKQAQFVDLSKVEHGLTKEQLEKIIKDPNASLEDKKKALETLHNKMKGLSAKDSEAEDEEDEDLEDSDEESGEVEEEVEDSDSSEEGEDSDEEMEDEECEEDEESDENDVKGDFDPNKGTFTIDVNKVASITPSEREELRLKLAQKGVQFSEMIQKAHGKGNVKTKLDVKVTGDLDKIETIEEQHAKFLEVAQQAVPKNVRVAAENIQKLVVAGEISPSTDFPGLIAQGLDSAAVAYWKKLYGEAKDPASTKFVSDLVKDFKAKKASDDAEASKVKIARAYELAYSMHERGLITRDPAQLRAQAEKIAAYPDEQFNHFESTLSKMPVKKASMVEVGVTDDSSEVVIEKKASENLVDLFTAALSGRKY